MEMVGGRDTQHSSYLQKISLYHLFDQLGNKEKEDVAWVLKQRIAGLI
jgi:hypothetical protein